MVCTVCPDLFVQKLGIITIVVNCENLISNHSNLNIIFSRFNIRSMRVVLCDFISKSARDLLAAISVCTAEVVSDGAVNPEDRFSHD